MQHKPYLHEEFWDNKLLLLGNGETLLQIPSSQVPAKDRPHIQAFSRIQSLVCPTNLLATGSIAQWSHRSLEPGCLGSHPGLLSGHLYTWGQLEPEGGVETRFIGLLMSTEESALEKILRRRLMAMGKAAEHRVASAV